MHALQRWITFISIVTMVVLVGLAGFTSLSKAQGGGTTTRVSVASDGTQGNSTSFRSAISIDGRYVVFRSLAGNLVSNDTGNWDIFIHDIQIGETSLISIASDGTKANNNSNSPSISSDGRYVAFSSDATNLVSNDTNNVEDVFIHDRQTGQTSRVSVASSGTQGNNTSYTPSISGNGRYVVFQSFATNLVGTDTNNQLDVFVHDRQTGQTTRVSVASDGTQSNSSSNTTNASISSDGHYVAFYSFANNLVANDTNSAEDVFVHDRQTGQTTRVSITSAGTQGNNASFEHSISSDGRYVTFQSMASNLVNPDTNSAEDIFVYDRQTGQTNRVSIASDGDQGNNASYTPSISADGRYVAFFSDANNLISADTNGVQDVFVHDQVTGQTSRVSIASDNTEGNNFSMNTTASISGDGRYVAFHSFANNLVPNDTNNAQDVFVRDREETPTPTPTINLTPSSTPSNTPPPGATFTPTSTWTPTPIINLTPSSTPSNTPPPSATFTPTSTWTPTPTPSNTPPPNTTFTPTSTWTPTPTPTVTNTPPSGATLTPTSTPTQFVSDEEVFIPLVLRQYGFATPSPATPTPTPTNTPLPTCEILDHEPNNFFIEANANLSLCINATVTGSVASNDIDDIYRIEVPTSGIVRIDLTNLPTGADYDLYLYNADRGEVTVANTPGSVNETIRINIPNGRYYIRVYSRTYAGSNTYQLRWLRE